MEKICSKCKTSKILDEFQFRNKDKGTYRSHCRDCVSAYDKWAYSVGIKTGNSKESKQAITERNQKYILDLLSQTPCKDCSNPDIRVLEFDHLRDKKFNISTMIKSYSLEKIKEEVAKCDIVCSNCHKIRTYNRRPNYRTIFMGV